MHTQQNPLEQQDSVVKTAPVTAQNGAQTAVPTGASKGVNGLVAGVVVVLGLVLGGGGVAYWAKTVTDPVAPKERTATLFIDMGEVSVRDAVVAGAAEAAFRPASQGEILRQGMAIRTAANAQAELRLFDSSVVRLAPDTELVLETLAHDPLKPTEDKIGLSVVAGRVWSRVLNLLSLNAQFEVKSSTTVATVRGTAFDFAVKKDAKGVMWTHVNGAESLIDCKTPAWKGVVKKGEWLHVPEEKTALKNLIPSKELAKADAKSGVAKGVYFGTLALPEVADIDWNKVNLDFDQQFLDWSSVMREEEAKEMARLFTMPIIGGLLEDLSEMRIANASGSERDALMATYAQRQLAQANVYATRGDKEDALLVVESLKNFRGQYEDLDAEESAYLEQVIMEQLGRGEIAKKYGNELIEDIPEMLDFGMENAALFQSVLMENHYRYLEEEAGDDWDPSMIPSFDLEGYEDVIQSNPILKERYEYLQDWQGQLQTLDWSAVQKSIETGDLSGMEDFTKQLEQLQQQLPGAEDMMNEDPEPMTFDVFDTVKDVTVPVTDTAGATTNTTLQSYLVPDGPSSLMAGELAPVFAYLVYSDGTRKDVSARGTWTVGGVGGSVSNGLYQSPEAAGTAILTFSFTDDDGSPRSTQMSILIEPHLDFGM